MKQTSNITRNLADAQEAHANRPAFDTPKTLFRLYTERLPFVDVSAVVARYFEGATIFDGVGLDARTQSAAENAVIIEIVSSKADAMQRALDLAGDLRVLGRQISVLVTVQEIRTFEVTSATVAEPHRIAGHRALDRATDSPRYNSASKAQAHRFNV